ncbi:hypothetical protein M885DRAFT_13394 [Pelagophyceae sp. CCMP2097]|nr:hypothetical protein M885DRAFT_13394 [Pelagophyceae sp. CCMP2097]
MGTSQAPGSPLKRRLLHLATRSRTAGSPSTPRVVRPAAWDRTTSDRPATSDGAATSDPATSTGRPASAAAPAKQKLVDAVRALGPRHWLAEGGYDAAKNVWRNDGFHAKDVERVVRAGTARVTRHCGHGASGALTAVCGGPDVELDFGNLFSGNSETFTVASLTRYAGAHMGRVLQGTQDWYHGHWGNPGRSEALVGHCKYGSVVKTDLSSKRTANIADWLAMTATNGADATAFANGERCCVRAGGRDAGSLGINRGAFGFERSDFAVAEVLVFDYARNRRPSPPRLLLSKQVVGTDRGAVPFGGLVPAFKAPPRRARRPRAAQGGALQTRPPRRAARGVRAEARRGPAAAGDAPPRRLQVRTRISYVRPCQHGAHLWWSGLRE